VESTAFRCATKLAGVASVLLITFPANRLVVTATVRAMPAAAAAQGVTPDKLDWLSKRRVERDIYEALLKDIFAGERPSALLIEGEPVVFQNPSASVWQRLGAGPERQASAACCAVRWDMRGCLALPGPVRGRSPSGWSLSNLDEKSAITLVPSAAPRP
jgi:hypothetical protein